MKKPLTVKRAVLMAACVLMISACMFLCFLYAPVSGATIPYWISAALVSILVPLSICSGIRCILYRKKRMEELEKK